MYRFILYRTPTCVRCEFVKRHYLNNENYKEVVIDEKRDNLRKKFFDAGFRSFPVTEVYQEEKLIDTFSGVDVPKLTKYCKR